MRGWVSVLVVALAACHSSNTADTPDDAGFVPDAFWPSDAGSDDAGLDPSAPLPPVSGGTMAALLDRVVVADPDRDAIFVFHVPPSAAGVLERTIELEPGDEPGRVVLDAERALVALRGSGELATIDLDDGSIDASSARIRAVWPWRWTGRSTRHVQEGRWSRSRVSAPR